MEHADVGRFVDAQAGGMYECALAEIRSGRKESHWIWFIFPQVRGLGRTNISNYYGIASSAELAAYIRHPVLMPRLREITRALLALDTSNPREVMERDAKKLCSCMTLFGDATGEALFQEVLDRFFGGRADENTRRIVAKW